MTKPSSQANPTPSSDNNYVLLQLQPSTKPRQQPIAPQNKRPCNTSLPMERQVWIPSEKKL